MSKAIHIYKSKVVIKCKMVSESINISIFTNLLVVTHSLENVPKIFTKHFISYLQMLRGRGHVPNMNMCKIK